MKTNFFKNAKESKSSELIEMSKKELKSIEGGDQWYFIRNPDGTFELKYMK